MPAPGPSDYRLAPALSARIVGVLLVFLALVLFAATALVAVLHLSPDLLVLLAVLGLVAVLGTGYVLTRRVSVVRFDDSGYRVRWIHGQTVAAAAWTDVEDAATSSQGGVPIVELTLTDGRTTMISVAALAADREDFVRDLQAHLQHGQGLRPL